MIVLVCLAALALVFRLATHRLRREDLAVVAVALVGFLMVWAQIWVADGKPFPERRYWLQGFVLLFLWAAWGACRVSDALARRLPPARFFAPTLVFLLLALDIVALFKPQIPVGRHYVHAQAGAWAAAAIRADWKGPARDEKVAFSIRDYHPAARPIVETPAHLRRVVYEVGGRHARMEVFGAADAPDYVLDENRQSTTLKKGGYELMAERAFGERHFSLYRRKTRHRRTKKP